MTQKPFSNLSNMIHEKKGDVQVRKDNSVAKEAMSKVHRATENKEK